VCVFVCRHQAEVVGDEERVHVRHIGAPRAARAVRRMGGGEWEAGARESEGPRGHGGGEGREGGGGDYGRGVGREEAGGGKVDLSIVLSARNDGHADFGRTSGTFLARLSNVLELLSKYPWEAAGQYSAKSSA
jgi:hypothetical protein